MSKEEQEKQELKKRYEEMPDSELLERLSEGETEYTETAYALLLEEAKKRGIDDLTPLNKAICM